MELQKFCENCYYFRQHYYKSNHGKLVKAIGDGHCTNGKLPNATSRKNILKCRACEYWEAKEQQITEQRESVCKIILKMHKRLEDIAFILKND